MLLPSQRELLTDADGRDATSEKDWRAGAEVAARRPLAGGGGDHGGGV